MQPNLEKATAKALETLRKHNMTENADPIAILKSLPNVLLLSSTENMDFIDHLCEFFLVDRNQDAFTIANKTDQSMQYIVVYKSDSPGLRLALAKELGHIILNHDGTEPENVWLEESSCFAHFFLCPIGLLRRVKPMIGYREKNVDTHWGMKNILHFDSIEHLKAHIIGEANKRNLFIGKNAIVNENDVRFVHKKHDIDLLTGWNNCCDVVLFEKTIGVCGEH